MLLLPMFQFLSGSIKRSFPRELGPVSCSRFNSFPVRLKVYGFHVIHLAYLAFQFLSGSIKSKCKTASEIAFSVISIPFRFD